jgi:hypothetical protein
MPNNSQPGTQLHLLFVEMLFALAIGQIAIGVSDLIDYQLKSPHPILSVVPAYSHLLLAAAVISTSWVGWRTSRFSGTKIKNVFTWDYIELLIDVALVVMYFVLARAVEIPRSPNDILSPNASFEAKTVAIIILTYVIWDFISCRDNPTKIKNRLWASIVCAIISWCLVLGNIGRHGTVLAVLLADCSLIFLILTFRAMKLYNLREHTIKSVVLICSLLFLVFICFIGSIKY